MSDPVAPEFPPDLEWVNASAPVSLAELRGRVTLLWFWTYDNVNCWNQMAELGRLEERFEDGLTIVGVHSPKFPHQRAVEPVLRAVNRHRLRFAVASDADFRLWQRFGVTGWPTSVLLDAHGRIAATFAGEGHFEAFAERIGALLDEASAQNLRVFGPSRPALEPEPATVLSFPGGILATAERLFIADSGHRRVLECTHDGTLIRAFGGGAAARNGSGVPAAFTDPQGLALLGGFLYVSDRLGHALWRVDLADGLVSLIAGGESAAAVNGSADVRTSINAPYGLASDSEALYVAMTGCHQVWRYTPGDGPPATWSGSGKLGFADGPAAEACFAQPAGIAVLDRELLVVDAAGSGLRSVSLADGSVETLLGAGMFESGRVDGNRLEARMQNPLALAIDPRGVVFIADTFNDAVRIWNRRSQTLRTLPIDYRLDEPSALSLAEGALWIANRNRHEIVRFDLADGTARRIAAGELEPDGP
ncbi:MAG: redoxin domain-containing protein [Lysobacterales bacterium]